MKIARWVTGRQKIVAFYRSYHGGTAGAISATGDRDDGPSRPCLASSVLNPYHGIERGWQTSEQALAYLDEVINSRASDVAGLILGVVGTNGVLVPPDGYLASALFDRRRIVVCDEVMSKFGRTGEWFAVIIGMLCRTS
jgi:taurine--2-oxoglutarate transaminase